MARLIAATIGIIGLTAMATVFTILVTIVILADRHHHDDQQR